MSSSKVNFANALCFTSYALLILFGLGCTVSGILSLLNETNKEVKMEEKRHIALEVIKVNNDRVTFKIAKQTHRGENFCKYGYHFEAANGIKISSVGSPCYITDAPYTVGLRGEDSEFDNDEIVVSARKFALICEAVTEYNETNGTGYGKKCYREDDPKYYYITSTGLIKCCIYDSRPINEQRRKFGNLFGTRAAAETALKHVKKALKGE